MTAGLSTPSFSPAVANAASEWLTLLLSGDVTDEQRSLWQAWRRADVEHERAWQHVEAMTGQLRTLHPAAAYLSLTQSRTRPAAATAPRAGRRRRALGTLMLLIASGLVTRQVVRSGSWQWLTASHRTGTGEQRELDLPDGTTVRLNTGSALDVSFDDRQRTLHLVTGEIWVQTGRAAPAAPPLVVETRDGRVRALGTRFGVHQTDSAGTALTVQEGAVGITPASNPGAARVLVAGRRLAFTATSIGDDQPAGDADPAWLRGLIVADNLPLEDFLADLGRYRPGRLTCDPAVARERLSGVFPVRDSDSILRTLPTVLPVQVTQRTRYWVVVEAAPGMQRP